MREEQIKEAIFKSLRNIAPEADLDALPPNADIRRALDIDSFDFLNVVIGLNEALGVEIPESDYGEVNTLSAMIRYLSKRLA
jgi:acyl carrier protein